MSSVPTLARIDAFVSLHDKEWRFHRLPTEDVVIGRKDVPDPSAETYPAAANRLESTADPERRWTDTGVNRIDLRPLSERDPQGVMGNEQSSRGGGGATAGKKGIVVVRDGTVIKPDDPNDDPDLKRLQEMPRFMPILRSSIGRRDVFDHRSISHRPILQLTLRLSNHFALCAKTVCTKQSNLTSMINSVDGRASECSRSLLARKMKLDRLAVAMGRVATMNEDIRRIQMALETLIPLADSVNGMLPAHLRCSPPALAPSHSPSLSPPTSSASSRGPSSATSTPSRRLPPIEEVRVVDKVVTVKKSEMAEPDLSFIQPDVALDEMRPLDRRRLLAMVNAAIVRVGTLLNETAKNGEETLLNAERRLDQTEIRLKLLEAKLQHIPVDDEATTSAAAMGAETPSERRDEAREGVSSEANEAPAEDGRILIRDDLRYAKYFKMLKMGVPEDGVRLKMLSEGVDPALLSSPDAPSDCPISMADDASSDESIATFSDSE